MKKRSDAVPRKKKAMEKIAKEKTLDLRDDHLDCGCRPLGKTDPDFVFIEIDWDGSFIEGEDA